MSAKSRSNNGRPRIAPTRTRNRRVRGSGDPLGLLGRGGDFRMRGPKPKNELSFCLLAVVIDFHRCCTGRAPNGILGSMRSVTRN